MKNFCFLAFLGLSLATVEARASTSCEPVLISAKPVKSKDGATYHIDFGNFELQYPAEGVDANDPKMALTDGFEIKKKESSKAACRGSAGINTEIYAALNNTRIVTFSYSGSTSVVEVINPEGCKTLSSIDAYTPKMSIQGSELTVVPACECGDDEESRCQCDPGGIYEFGKNCVLKRDDAKSLAQTQSVLGVGFAKESWIAHPGGPKAKLLEAWKAK